MKNQNSIGVISKAFTNKILIEISNKDKINHNYKGDLYLFEGINTFITIYKSRYQKFIYQVTGLFEQEKPLIKEEESKFSDCLYFEATPLGEIENKKFNFGLSKFPMIGDYVYLTLTEDINTILQLNNQIDLSLSIGSMAAYDGYYPRFNVDELLSHHMSILGNTGSGKSTTVRKLINEVIESAKDSFDIDSANFVIFDVHDEYNSIPSDNVNEVDVEDDLAIPLSTLCKEDWINLVQPSPGVQLPVLLNGLRLGNLISKETDFNNWINAYCALFMYENVQTEVVGKRTKIVNLLKDIDDEKVQEALRSYSSQFGSISNGREETFIEALKIFIKKESGYHYEDCKEVIASMMEEADCSVDDLSKLETGINMVFLFEEIKGNSQVRSHCSTLMTRIDNLIATYSNSLFDKTKEKIEEFNKIMSFRKGFTIFKVSSMDDNDLLFFTGYVLRIIYNTQKDKRRNQGNIEEMFHFIFDEAHKYIQERSYEEPLRSLKVFEQISKEGRKFGIFMILVSQRPGELSKTVMSQCNNFILHRIRNNIDLDQMRKSIPYINESQLTRISYLRTGSALLVGEAFSVPMEVLVNGSEYGEYSKTILPSKIWKRVAQVPFFTD
ncbi:ATP-binding protein [Virgibacillus litoralis]|uniref:DNA helicase HerA-like ATPase n=1 Tax=Virgibacillus litoralis TaxID=578221 RepID=A0ABS4HAU5_9BACI|nr:ATP-binding protein [Virgibacillus litoralis]MBP1947869.1 DNA helicase HerA-like ATPase [Virgibacillus litoralis]